MTSARRLPVVKCMRAVLRQALGCRLQSAQSPLPMALTANWIQVHPRPCPVTKGTRTINRSTLRDWLSVFSADWPALWAPRLIQARSASRSSPVHAFAETIHRSTSFCPRCRPVHAVANVAGPGPTLSEDRAGLGLERGLHPGGLPVSREPQTPDLGQFLTAVFGAAVFWGAEKNGKGRVVRWGVYLCICKAFFSFLCGDWSMVLCLNPTPARRSPPPPPWDQGKSF